eukprot:COSAG06_NODE_7780_length_2378_cov_4.945590_3_plen_87_part_00
MVVPLAATRRANELQQSSQGQVSRAAAAESVVEEEGMRTLLVVDRRRLLPLLRGSGLGSIVPCRDELIWSLPTRLMGVCVCRQSQV